MQLYIKINNEGAMTYVKRLISNRLMWASKKKK